MSARFPTSRKLKVDELIEKYDNIIPQVDEALMESAISDQMPMPNIPEGLDGYVDHADNGDPIAPDDVTEIESTTLGKLFSYVTNWANYIQSEHTRAKCVQIVQERNKKVVDAALQTYYVDEQDVPVSHVQAKITVDPRYIDVDTAFMRAQVFALKADTRLSQLKRSLTLVSREVTRRGEELERTIHEHNKKPKTRWERGHRR